MHLIVKFFFRKHRRWWLFDALDDAT